MAGIDDKQRSIGPAARAVDRSSSPPKTDAGSVPAGGRKKENVILLEHRDVSIGAARFEGASRLSKNVAVKPNYMSKGGDLMVHANIEIHLYDDAGNEVKMTNRYFRDWAMYPLDPKKTIETLSIGDALPSIRGDAGAQPNYRVIPNRSIEMPKTADALRSRSIEMPKTADALRSLKGSGGRFRGESGSVFDAPGQQNIFQDKQTYVYLQEFIAGDPKAGGFYYHVVTTLDPDGTTRILVKNVLPLSRENYKFLMGIIADPNFATEYANKFVIDNLPGTINSDSGIDRTIPNIVEKRKTGK